MLEVERRSLALGAERVLPTLNVRNPPLKDTQRGDHLCTNPGTPQLSGLIGDLRCHELARERQSPLR